MCQSWIQWLNEWFSISCLLCQIFIKKSHGTENGILEYYIPYIYGIFIVVLWCRYQPGMGLLYYGQFVLGDHKYVLQWLPCYAYKQSQPLSIPCSKWCLSNFSEVIGNWSDTFIKAILILYVGARIRGWARYWGRTRIAYTTISRILPPSFTCIVEWRWGCINYFGGGSSKVCIKLMFYFTHVYIRFTFLSESDFFFFFTFS